jgi:hypothetical protein
MSTHVEEPSARTRTRTRTRMHTQWCVNDRTVEGSVKLGRASSDYLVGQLLVQYDKLLILPPA